MSRKSLVPKLAGTVRPRLGLKPKRPQAAAGMRIEPPPSFAWASGTRPAATAAALPPDEPAAEYETKLPPIAHSKYYNTVTLEERGDAIILRGHESSVEHVHVYDAATGALRHHDP